MVEKSGEFFSSGYLSPGAQGSLVHHVRAVTVNTAELSHGALRPLNLSCLNLPSPV